MDLIRYEPASGLLSYIDTQLLESNNTCAIVLQNNEELVFWSDWWSMNGKSDPTLSCSYDQIHQSIEKVFVIDSIEAAEQVEVMRQGPHVIHCEWNRGKHEEPSKGYIERFLLSGYDKLAGKHCIERIGQ